MIDHKGIIVKHIKEEADSIKAIGLLADLSIAMDKEIHGKIEEIDGKLDGVITCVKGNGIKGRLVDLESKVKLLMWLLSATGLIVLGYVLNAILRSAL